MHTIWCNQKYLSIVCGVHNGVYATISRAEGADWSTARLAPAMAKLVAEYAA